MVFAFYIHVNYVGKGAFGLTVQRIACVIDILWEYYVKVLQITIELICGLHVLDLLIVLVLSSVLIFVISVSFNKWRR